MQTLPIAKMRRTKLSLAVLLIAYGMNAMADTVPLGSVMVIGEGQGSLYEVAQPVVVLDRNAVDNNPGSTLGTLLESTPGVSNAAFGAGVGRPVIRGMSGNRVRVLVNGSDSADVSAMSSDHAPMAEATAAEQVEVIYGPATLLYGSGATGGVVNLLDGRIHEQPGEGISGDVTVKGSTNDRGYSTNALMDIAQDNWTLHVDGLKRDADNYRSGRRGKAPDGYNQGRIANSDSNGSGGAVALSWADGKRGFIGGSISTLEYDYGVPNLDGSTFRVTPEQTRYDIKGAWWPDPNGRFAWLDEWRAELSFNDYQHAETGEENDIPGASIVDVGLFDQQSWELQSRLRHAYINDWQGTIGVQIKYQELALCHDHGGCDGIPGFSGPWDGQIGFNLQSRERGGFLHSHDTPMPLTDTLQTGLFIVEQRDWYHGTLELGARLDNISIRADADSIDPNWRQPRGYYDEKTFNPTTLSAAGTWILSHEQRLGLTLARVQRAPDASEIYWNGDHHATFSFQLDNPDLGMETAWTVDLNWMRQTERDKMRAALFYYHYSDYIYNDLKDFTDPFHGNDVYRHEQDDAHFHGAEFSWQRQLTERWHLDTQADVVLAELTNGEKLPRTPPASLLLALNYKQNGWNARLENKWVVEQNATSNNESSSNSHHLINARIGYQHILANSEVQLNLAVQNLTDRYATNHVSYLKQAGPLPGRNLQMSVRWRF